MRTHGLTISITFLVGAFIWGCQESGPIAPEQLGSQLAVDCDAKPDHPKCSGGGGDGGKPTWTEADVVVHSVPDNAATLKSTCPGFPPHDTRPSVDWPRHDQCANVTPEGSGVTLTDDPFLEVTVKAGEIIGVQYFSQDVIGAEGVQYESEFVSIAPVQFTGAGFTLHVDQTDIPVWMLSGHTGGKRVMVVGTMNIGDIVYR